MSTSFPRATAAVLVAHDSSDPPAIDWALTHADHVAALVLLNTYYGWTPRLRPPEAIILYSTPVIRNLAHLVMRRFDRLDERLYAWQVGRFIRDDAVRREVVPALYEHSRYARHGISKSLPAVRRDWRSSCARRASASG
jgi:haloalkane dehalogenase